jgi:hypothetical protein
MRVGEGILHRAAGRSLRFTGAVQPSWQTDGSLRLGKVASSVCLG